MGRNNRRHHAGKPRGKNTDMPQAPVEQGQKAPLQPAAVKKTVRGIFDFSEAELAEDTSLRLISGSAQNGEAKFASFEDYLKKR